MEHAETTCANCGASLTGRFCAQCGQERRPTDPTLSDLGRELAREILDVDGRVVGTLLKLFLAPGRLTNEYLAGRRAAWLPPVRLYLVVSLVYFALTSWIGDFGINVVIEVGSGPQSNSTTELETLGFADEQAFATAAREAQQRWLPRAMFVLMPIFAGLVQISRRRTGGHYPRQLIFSLHVHTAWFGIFTVLAAMAAFLPDGFIGNVLDGLGLPLAVLYLVIAYWRVYGVAFWRAAIVGVLLAGIYGLLAAIVTAGIVLRVVLAGA